jgi:hypothetical protein
MYTANRVIERVALIVAHPDDETLWAGGLLLINSFKSCFVLSICRRDDKDRAPRFSRAKEIISWISEECDNLKKKGDLPGDYHNGGIWPFITGFYIAALVAAEEYQLAEEKLLVLTEQIRKSSDSSLSFGFNEWIKAQNGAVKGQDWQTWSAAMYIYAVHSVRERKTPFFDRIRENRKGI